MKKSRPRLSYANVVSTLCLFLVLGGGAAFAATRLARNSVGTKQIRNGAVTRQKLSRSARGALRGATGPQGKQGIQGKQGKQGNQGNRGIPGIQGTPGTALAYAHVNANGTLDAPNSKNLASVQTAQAGYYCVTSSVPVHNIVVTADVAGAPSSATASLSDPFTSCKAGDVVVSTFNAKGEYTSTPFYIAIN